MSTVIVIQARMGSTRFPGKVLAPLARVPVIDRVIDRALQAKVGPVIVAMPATEENHPLMRYLRGIVTVSAGSETDVLKRYAHAVAAYASEADTVVRLTADCPLVDPETIAGMVEQFHGLGVPYLGRTNAPDGNDVEVFSAVALKMANHLAGDDEREHVTTWMRKRTDAVTMTSTDDTSDVKYSVDTIEDLRVCERLVLECGPDAGWKDYVAALRRWRAA